MRMKSEKKKRSMCKGNKEAHKRGEKRWKGREGETEENGEQGNKDEEKLLYHLLTRKTSARAKSIHCHP